MQDEAETPAAEGRVVELKSKLESASAQDLRNEILSHKGNDIQIDANEVDLLGGRCAEVLVAAFNQWEHDGKSIAIKDGSDSFWSDAQLLGIEQNFRAADK